MVKVTTWLMAGEASLTDLATLSSGSTTAALTVLDVTVGPVPTCNVALLFNATPF